MPESPTTAQSSSDRSDPAILAAGSFGHNKNPGLVELHSHRAQSLRLGAYQIDIGALKLITESGETRRLTPKTMSVLLELALRPAETIARDELLEAVWPNTCPTPEVLTQAIKELRKAFQDDQKAPNYIETIPKVGYRLLKKPIWSETPELVTPTDSPTSPVALEQVASIARVEPTSPKSRRVWAGVATLLFAALCLSIYWLRAPPQNPSNGATDSERSVAMLHSVKDSFRLLTTAPGIERAAVISGNGAWLAYVTHVDKHHRIWVRDLATPSAQRLTTDNSDNAYTSEFEPHFSKDGLEIAYVRQRVSDAEGGAQCEIIAQRVLAGAPRKLMDCPPGMVLPFDWPSANELVFAHRWASDSESGKPGTVAIVAYQIDSGRATRLHTNDAGPDLNGQPSFDWHARRSPNGQLLAFRRGVGSDSTLFLSDANGQNVRSLVQLAQEADGFAWLPDSQGIIAAIAVEGDFELTLLREGQAAQPLAVFGRNPSVANTGQVVFSRKSEQISLYEFSLADALDGVRLFPSTGSDGPPSLSPDGESIAFLSSRGGIDQVWLGKRGEQPQAVTHTPARLSAIFWHPSGKRFLFTRLQPQRMHSELIEFELDRSRTRSITPPADLGMIVRANYYGEDLLLLSSLNGKRVLQKWHPTNVAGAAIAAFSSEKPWQLLWQLEQIASFQHDQKTNKLYFTRVGSNTLYERLADGRAQVVFDKFNPRWHWNWRVAAGVVYYFSEAELGVELHAYDLATATDRTIRSLPAGDLALDLAQQTTIVPIQMPAEMDIASVQLPAPDLSIDVNQPGN